MKETSVAPAKPTDFGSSGQVVKPSCPYCQSNELEDLGPCCIPDELLPGKAPAVIVQIAEQLRESRLAKCNECSLLFRTPQLSEDDLTRLYTNLPETIWQYDETKVGSWICAKRFLENHFASDESPSVLDVGAYDGTFLRQLSSRWKTAAIEPSIAGREQLAAHGIPVVSDFVQNVTKHADHPRFDVVTLFDVFEHLPAPADTLEVLVKLLNPSGLLLISTCNADHWTWRAMQGQHWYLHSAQHLCFATSQFFRSWASSHKMQLVDLIPHPHQVAASRTRWRQAMEITHAWARTTGKTFLARGIQSIPGFGHLAHKQGVVFANSLNDHQLAIFSKAKDAS